MSDNRIVKIEEKLDPERYGGITIATASGAIAFEKVGEMMDFAKLMAISDLAVPVFLRGNVGACLAITVQANEWGFSPFAVARMCYRVGDQFGFFAQLLHAVVERRAPLRERLRFTYDGEGVNRRVIVKGHLRGEVEPLVYESPTIANIKVKNSPLWVGDPDQQLAYYGARAWARRYVPDVLLGVYSADELQENKGQSHVGAEAAKDVTPGKISPAAAAKAGFDPAGIAQTIDGVTGAVVEDGGASAERASSTEAGHAVPADEATAADVSSPSVETAVADPQAEQAIETADMIAKPVDGAGYLQYVEACLPLLRTEKEVKDWWRAGSRLRNELPNLSGAVDEAAVAAKNARLEELRKV